MIPWLIGCWEVGCWLYEKHERRLLFRQALAYARASGKPMLVVGEPDGEYPCPPPPGVLVDLRARSVCPRHVRVSIERMPMFKDKQFASCFVSHTLEHVDRPLDALRELHRVADRVFISYPRPWRMATYLVPGHTWLMVLNRKGGFAFHRLRSTSNVPNRYGLMGAGVALRGRFLREGRPRTSIRSAAIGLARVGDPRVLRWVRTDEQGRFVFVLDDPGPWSLRTRVGGVLVAVPLGRVEDARDVDLVVDSRGVATAYHADSARRWSFAAA